MASRAHADGDTPGKKPGAAGELEKPGSKKSDISEERVADLDAYGNEIPPYPPIALTNEERMQEARRVAAYVDAVTAQRRAADEKAQFDEENPPFSPDITSLDPEWIKKRAFFLQELKDKTIKDVLEDANISDRSERDITGQEIFSFGKYQFLQLWPSSTDGIVLDIQRENASTYKEALKSERFRGVHDNLATKLTMLYFGLPIEAMTSNNMIYSGLDQDDEPDALPEPPRLQRILYSEKPLEFLDSYHERSYGNPVLRRPKYTRPATIPPRQDTPPVLQLSSVVPALPSGQQPRIRAREPVQPTGSSLGMRGGAVTTRVLYNHYGGRKELSVGRSTQLVSATEFRDAALDLLQLHPDSSWIIIFDQYNNSEMFKDDLQKKFVRSFEVTRDNFQKMFHAYLQARISNKEDDWILVAAYKHLRLPGGEKCPPTFVPSRSTGVGGRLPDAKSRPPFSPTADHLPAPPAAASSVTPASSTARIPLPGPRRKIYHYKGPASSLASDGSDESTFEDRAAALEEAIKKLMKKTTAQWIVVITVYSSGGNRTVSIPFRSGADEIAYRQLNGFDSGSSVIVCHEPAITAPARWPRTRQPKPPRAEAPIYLLNSNLGRRVQDDGRDFFTQALSLLGLHASNAWEFYVGFYADETREDAETRYLQHEVLVNKENAAGIYDSRIRDLLFDRFHDYHVTVRAASGRGLRRFDSKGANFNVPPSAGPPQARIPERFLWDPPLLKDHIYAYGGTFPVANLTSAAFISASLALLGLCEGDEWQFFVETYDRRGRPSEWALWTKTVHNVERFKNEILPCRNSDDATWPVFVRRSNAGPSAGSLQPPVDQLDVCRLKMSDGRTAYWKLPSPASRNYGINQVQNDFFSAMRVFFPRGRTRPEERIMVDGFDLGIGGMEITRALWDRVARDVQRGTAAREYRVEGVAARNDSTMARTQLFRMPGTVTYGEYAVGNYEDFAAKIMAHSKSVLGSVPVPKSFRMWYTAEDREDGINSRDFDYLPLDRLATDLGKWVATKSDRPTNCVWLRPIWGEFRLFDTASNRMSVWKGETAASLEQALVKTSPGSSIFDAKFVNLAVASSNQQFAHHPSTATEENWRMHVFDQLLGNTIAFRIQDEKSRDDLAYGITPPYCICSARLLTDAELKNLDQAWGIWQRGTSNIARPRPLSQNPPRITPTGQKTPAIPESPVTNTLTSASPVKQPPFARTRAPLPPGHRRRVPRSEYVPLFDSWMSEQNAQNSLQKKSWTQDQSVIEPGHKLETPLFGDMLELPLTVGPNLPTVYAQHLTPTDIAQLLRDRRKAVNHVLERETACPICSEVFASYDNEKKKKHYEQHTEQIHAGRVCPLCEDANWRFWTLSQKRDHLINDQNEQVKAEIKAFWSVTRCPVCNEEFRDLTAEQVIAHLAAHIPGALKFCDRCGLDISSSTPAEISHHDRACVFVAVRPPNVDWLCNLCGKEDKSGHESTHPGFQDPSAPFCVRCGLSLAKLDESACDDHGSRCRRPSGPSAVFCKRCGIDLSSLDALGFAAHNNECYRTAPTSIAGGSLATLAKAKAVEKQRIQNDRDLTELQRQRAELAQRKSILARRETDVLAQEILVGDRVVDLADLGACPFPSCSFDLGTRDRVQLLDHLRFHAGAASAAIAGDASSSCDTDELLKALAEFKRRMPGFRAAHAALNALAIQTSNNMKEPMPDPTSSRTETRSPAKKNADDAVRNANNRHMRARIGAARESEAGDATVKAALDAAVALGKGQKFDADTLAKRLGDRDQKAADDAAAKAASLAVTANPDPEQSGLVPSPARGSSKEFRSPRKSRSVRGRAPTTGNKRKKAAMDEPEDTLSGWSSMQRSPSKRESKKMKTSTHLSSPDKRRRRVVGVEEDDGSSEFDGESLNMMAPKRMTRAASGAPGGGSDTAVAPPRRVGRPRKTAAVEAEAEAEAEAEDDGFEDVEEEDADEEVLAKLSKKSPGKT
ncbi:hypothetical protein JHW43_003338 [Diplocarpon mali]|nr:hypothetical protein JHW43_003338 [Diplocarpon mali]